MCRGRIQYEPQRRHSRESIHVIRFMTLFAVLLFPVKRSSAYLHPMIPKCSISGTPRRIHRHSYCYRNTPSILTLYMSPSFFRPIEDTKNDRTAVFMELEEDINVTLSVRSLEHPGAILSYRSDGSNENDDEKNNTSLSQFFSRLPPFRIEDWNVLLYDILLIVNLSISVSFWVVHRYDVSYIGRALNEGCLLSLLWIGAGLWNGSFLYTSVDGHYSPSRSQQNRLAAKEVDSNRTKLQEIHQGGPVAAGLLALHSFINTINLRLLYALIIAVIEHRPALSSSTELLVPLELGYGLILMILWRALHSSFVLR
jgi:hypothetical protein